MPQTMRAVQYAQAAKQLSLIEMPVPSPSQQRYLVKVSAAAITSGELTWPRPAHADPFTPCVEFAGVVAIAPDIGKFKAGSKVYMRVEYPNPGAAADYITATETELTLRPTNLSAVQAAAVPVSALTAWQGIYEHSYHALQREAPPGNDTPLRILINGGSTSVGLWYMQLLRASPFRELHITTTCSATNIKLVKDFGADIVCDRAKTHISDLESFDIIYDCVGGIDGSLDECWTSLAPHGTLYTIVPPSENVKFGVTRLSVPPFLQGNRYEIEGYFFVMKPSAIDLEQITELIEQGKVRVPLIRAEYGMEAYEEAFAEVGEGAGKVVFKINDEE